MMKDMAHAIAERYIDFYYEKLEEENTRKYNRLQKRKELRKKRARVIVLSGVLVVMIVMCMALLGMEMRVRNQANEVVDLQARINDVVNQNEDMKKRLMDSADYRWVACEAQKLGMTYPGREHVCYYDVPKEDYMLQLDEIPEE